MLIAPRQRVTFFFLFAGIGKSSRSLARDESLIRGIRSRANVANITLVIVQMGTFYGVAIALRDIFSETNARDFAKIQMEMTMTRFFGRLLHSGDASSASFSSPLITSNSPTGSKM